MHAGGAEQQRVQRVGLRLQRTARVVVHILRPAVGTAATAAVAAAIDACVAFATTATPVATGTAVPTACRAAARAAPMGGGGARRRRRQALPKHVCDGPRDDYTGRCRCHYRGAVLRLCRCRRGGCMQAEAVKPAEINGRQLH